MTRIYTRTGDQGETSLFGGSRVSKADPRVRAYGAVDELNAALGLARSFGIGDLLDARIDRIQRRLFQVGAELSTVPDSDAAAHVRGPEPGWSAELESEIDEMAGELPELTSFVVPGGLTTAAALHLARTVARRAERECVAAAAADHPVSPALLTYLNRLSDWLFTAARWESQRAGGADDHWRQDEPIPPQ